MEPCVYLLWRSSAKRNMHLSSFMQLKSGDQLISVIEHKL